jgi:hypothetical protein
MLVVEKAQTPIPVANHHVALPECEDGDLLPSLSAEDVVDQLDCRCDDVRPIVLLTTVNTMRALGEEKILIAT